MLLFCEGNDTTGYLYPVARFLPVVVDAPLSHAVELETQVGQCEQQEDELREGDKPTRQGKC